LEEGSENYLGTTECWKSKPESKDEFEGVVEWEPVDSVDGALKESQECENNPVSQPLRIISLAYTEQSLKGVVSWDSESSKICEELSCNVEEDQEEVDCDDT